VREVVNEQPLRILADGEPIATVMATPGGEVELALGFMLTEGLIRSPKNVGAVSFCRSGSLGKAGEVRVHLLEKLPQGAGGRYREVLSSCGLCGAELIEAFAEDLHSFAKPAGRLSADDVFRLRDAMERAQTAFARTGGTHAAALAELPVKAADGQVVVREDLGRHNALDKAVGAAASKGMALERSLLLLSGRLSFEMVAKAARAGISDVAGLSAPSALGVALACKLGMFLAGFVRGDAMTVYSGFEALSQREEG
jgi:FdhD protein